MSGSDRDRRPPEHEVAGQTGSDAPGPPETPEQAEEAGPEERGEELAPSDLGLDLPEEPEEAMQALLKEIAQARAQAESHLDDLRRVAAEFDNFRKRMLREQTRQVERASERVAAALLPVLDSFDLALAHDPSSPAEQKLLDGIQRTYELLMDVLRREGLEVIPAEGSPFDPEVHEAVSAPEGPAEGELVVTEELRRGYRLGGRVIRPALVAVGTRQEPSEENTGEPPAEAPEDADE